MNYLAHAYLAGPVDSDRVGGVVGDFVKGLLSPPPPALSPTLVAGVALHRSIDSFADRHPAFQRSRARVSAARRRVAGIMVDMFYDHFLATHWDRLRGLAGLDGDLSEFTAQTYRLIAAHGASLPPAFRPVFARMAADDWLAAYRDPATVALALDRMAVHRLRRPNPLAGAGEELWHDYAGFEEDCLAFLPDALEWVATVRLERGARRSLPPDVKSIRIISPRQSP